MSSFPHSTTIRITDPITSHDNGANRPEEHHAWRVRSTALGAGLVGLALFLGA